MYLGVEKIVKKDSWNRTSTKHVHKFQCDECGKSYDLYRNRKRRLHFCSKSCKNASKLLQRLITDVCIERYGGRGNASIELKLKNQTTCLKIYGASHPWKNDDVHEKCMVTTENLHGSRGYFGTKNYKKALKENWNVDHSMHSGEIKEKHRNTCLANLGVEYPLQSSISMKKMNETCNDKFGVKWGFQIESCIRNSHTNEAHKKRHETLKKNGSYTKSRWEDRFHEFLCSRFSIVERQVSMNQRWAIDFYVEQLDSYVQFDGVYWHGLDRDENEIKNSTNKRDKTIFKKFLTDKTQNEWFKEQNLKLVRITDKEFMSCWKTQNFSGIDLKLSGE